MSIILMVIFSLMGSDFTPNSAQYYYNQGKKIPLTITSHKKSGGTRIYRNSRGGELITNSRVIIYFKKRVDDTALKNLLTQYQGSIVSRELIKEGEIIILNTALDPVVVANDIYEKELVYFSEPDLILPHIKRGLNDTYLSDQWHLQQIRALEAWKTTTGDKDIKIAVLDDGVAKEHPDLDTKLSVDFSKAGFLDGGEHGTACAGLAAGKGDNGKGISGVCPDCTLMVAKIMTGDGYSPVSSDREAFYWASANGARVISCSWGFPEEISVPDYLRITLNQLSETGCGGKGCVILFASGNSNTRYDTTDRINNLEELDSVITVGAVTQRGYKTSYSNYGDNIWISAPSGDQNVVESDYLGVVTTDFYQPGITDTKGYNRGGIGEIGGEVIGPDIDSTSVYTRGAYTRFFSGTSAAAPIAAGAVGLLLSYRPDLTFQDVKEILKESADPTSGDHDATGHSQKIGYGVIDIEAALKIGRCYGKSNSGEHCGNQEDDDCDDLIDLEDPDCNCDLLTCPGGSSCIIAPEDGFLHCACPSGTLWQDDRCVVSSCALLQCDPDREICIDLGAEPRCGCIDGYLPDLKTGVCTKINCTITECNQFYDNSYCELNNGLSSCICDTVPCDLPALCKGVDCGAGRCYLLEGSAACICPEGYLNYNNSCIKGLDDPCLGIDCGAGSCVVQDDYAFCSCNRGYESKGLSCVEEIVVDDSSCQYGSSSRGIYLMMLIFLGLIVIRKSLRTDRHPKEWQ